MDQMNKLKNAFNNKSIRFKLLVNYLLTIILIIFSLSLINSNRIAGELEKLLNKNTSQILKQIKSNMEFYVKDIENIHYYISQNEDVQKYLNSYVLSYEERQILAVRINSLLKTYTQSHPEIGGILIAKKDGSFISPDMVAITKEPLTLDDWYNKAIDDPTNVQLFSKPIKRNIKSIYDYYSADNMVSIVKAVDDGRGIGYSSGVVLVDLKINTIGNQLMEKGFNDQEFFYIIDKNQQVVFAPVNKIVYRVATDWIDSLANPNAGNMKIQNIGDASYQTLYIYSDYIKCNFVGVFSLNPTLNLIRTIQKDTIYYAILLLLFGIVIVVSFTESITKPIRNLQGLMKRAADGEWDVEFEVHHTDEIGQLGNSFNMMIESIKNLINIVYIEQQQKKEAELKVFQAQIKPHFLYNTLDTINWMAQEYNADDISEIVVALTNLFRISLSKGKEIIALKEEILQVESYLTIQMVRYRGKFEYEIKCPEHLKYCQVIKLILQPLVENAIYHGIKTQENYGFIQIDIQQEGDILILSVEDDGAGIEPEKLEEMNALLDGKSSNANPYGIGIFNVNARIQLTYGKQFGVKLYSEIGKGTRAVITQPYTMT